MAINQEEKLHGAAVLRIFEGLGDQLHGISFSLRAGKSRNCYLIDGLQPKTFGKGKTASVGLFIKTSQKRLTPWRYNFSCENQDELLELKNNHGEAFAIFAAGDDGFACLDFQGLKEILDDHHEEQEWVSITRKPRQGYRVAGNDGVREAVLPRNVFPQIVIDYFIGRFQN